ncbi:MAG: hypothetical protein AB7P49_19840 [Bdellovibrionales bacterium]
MSRAYRIKVSESLRKTIRGEDHVSTQLEILNLLPPEEMAQLLRDELDQRGFLEEENCLVRDREGIRLVIDPSEGLVTVEVAGCAELELQKEGEGYSWEQEGDLQRKAEIILREKVKRDLEKEAREKQGELQQELTDKLEAELADLRRELDQIASAVTANALKRKAAQMGQIKEISEDRETGSMTIVLEV